MNQYLFKVTRTTADDPEGDTEELITAEKLTKQWPNVAALLPVPSFNGLVWELSLLHDLTFTKVEIERIVRRGAGV